ncbi:MAG: hypothetical protein ACE5F9_07390 [Phycisphaerae bacterium]
MHWRTSRQWHPSGLPGAAAKTVTGPASTGITLYEARPDRYAIGMAGRPYTTPLLIENDRAIRLKRLPFGERRFDEEWLQDLLFRHPSLIPVDEIEPVFAPAVPVARELPTPSGPLDILYLTPGGYPTLVETKLWRNPEARRQVVAQVIDYATQLSKWSYEDLIAAVRRTQASSADSDPLVALMEGREEAWEQARFVDTVTRNLRQGRMLLLIVGDGIHESVEQMAETLSRTPQLGFSLALVEMGLFEPADRSEPLFVQPRIIARTREVVRAIVQIRGQVEPEDVHVETPAAERASEAGQRRTLTQEAFFETLAEEGSSRTAEELREFLREVESCGIEIVTRQASLSLHYIEPSGGARFSFGSVYVHGSVDMYYVLYYCQKASIDEQIARDYLEEVSKLVPATQVNIWEAKDGLCSAIKIGKRHVLIQELLPRRTDWLAAIDRMISRINDAAKRSDIE